MLQVYGMFGKLSPNSVGVDLLMIHQNYVEKNQKENGTFQSTTLNYLKQPIAVELANSALKPFFCWKKHLDVHFVVRGWNLYLQLLQ